LPRNEDESKITRNKGEGLQRRGFGVSPKVVKGKKRFYGGVFQRENPNEKVNYRGEGTEWR